MHFLVTAFCALTLTFSILSNRPPIRYAFIKKPQEEFTLKDKKIAALEIAALLNEDVYSALLTQDPIKRRKDLLAAAEFFKAVEKDMIAYLTVTLRVKSTDLEKEITRERLKKMRHDVQADYTAISDHHEYILNGLDEQPSLSITITPPAGVSPHKTKAEPINPNFLHPDYKPTKYQPSLASSASLRSTPQR